MKRAVIFLLLPAGIFLSGATLAAPPPGHMGAEQAIESLGARPSNRTDAELPHAGEVLSATDANAFTYLEVRDRATGKPRWLAVPLQKFSPGDQVRFDEGRLMTNFHSRKLDRTFESVMFVSRIVVTPR